MSARLRLSRHIEFINLHHLSFKHTKQKTGKHSDKEPGGTKKVPSPIPKPGILAASIPDFGKGVIGKRKPIKPKILI